MGLAFDVRVRTLVLHQDEGFREGGLALSVSYNPTPSTPLGFIAKGLPRGAETREAAPRPSGAARQCPT